MSSLASHPPVVVAVILRRLNRSLRPVDALDAARYLLSVSESELRRLRQGGFTSCASSLRSMAYLHRERVRPVRASVNFASA